MVTTSGPAPLPDEPAEVTLAREVHLNLLLLANQHLEAIAAVCKDEGLTHAQYVALWVLCLADDPEVGVPIGAVADGRLNRASDTTRLVDRLERDGLAERYRNPEDRRGVLVRATPAGRAAFDRTTPRIQELHRTQWAALTTEETEQLGRLLVRALWGSQR